MYRFINMTNTEVYHISFKSVQPRDVITRSINKVDIYKKGRKYALKRLIRVKSVFTM